MAAEEDRSSWISPLPLIALILVAAGVLVKIPPLETGRPTGDRVVSAQPAVQDVEARLWQDPFVVRNVALPDRDLRKLRNPDDDKQHAPEKLTAQIKQVLADKQGDLAILGAMAFGTTYAEDMENRRRTRYAVIAALQESGYQPDNADALGYVWLPDPGPTDAKDGVRLPEIVPYEWFSRSSLDESAPKGSPTKVLLLWIDESALGEKPIGALELLIGTLLCGKLPEQVPKAGGCAQTKRPIKIIGPAGSSALKAIYDDSREPRDASKVASRPIVDLVFYSSAATIPPRLLSATLPKDLENRAEGVGEEAYLFSWPSPQGEGIDTAKGGKVYRVAAGDERTAGALAHELVELRGLGEPWGLWNPFRNGGSSSEGKCSGLVVLISEADTQYGQALGNELEHALAEQCRRWGGEPNLQRVRYFRGLDGLIGVSGKPSDSGASKPAQGRSGGAEVELPAAPPEHAEGRGQYDYLRRLSTQLVELNAAERRADRPGIRAVGILGSDVYDKLLVLQALRGALPHAVFFTTDLDARLLHPDQARWARNVVTASGYGLALRREIQGAVPPFRDSYQTGTYLATLTALQPGLEQALRRDWFDGVQVFEIGRTRPVEFTRGGGGLRELVGESTGPGVGREDRKSACSLAHPRNCTTLYFDPKDSGRAPLVKTLSDHWVLALLAIASGVGFILATMRTVITRRSALPLALGLIAPFLLVSWLALRDDVSGSGEPLEWLEGVSLWPIVFLRLLAAVLAVVFLVYGWTSMQRRLRDIGNRFFVGEPSSGGFPHDAHQARWRDLARHLFPARCYTCRESDMRPFMMADGEAVDAPRLWQHFLSEGRFVPAAIRVAVSLLLFLGLATLVFLFDPPNLPSRGEVVRPWSAWTTLLSFVLLWTLVFAVVDATRRAGLLVRCIAEHRIRWPAAAVAPFEKEIGLSGRYLGSWIGFSASVEIARSVEQLVYLPFVVVLLLVITFSTLFDALNLPTPLVIVFVGAIVYLLYCARSLRLAAEAARSAALSSYRDVLARLKGGHIESEGPGIPMEGDASRIRAQIEDLSERIKSERKGAFGPILQQPYLKGLLIPFGGYGGMSLLEYFLVGRF